ncbi:MAG: hypothetical protein H7196_00515 [candidate division SR1 bacterium]|nr:hypothetical protein [candidate division SR1 bacterium]
MSFTYNNYENELSQYDYLCVCDNIKDLVNKIRNASTHPNSGDKLFDKENIIISSFNVLMGTSVCSISTDSRKVICELDDVMFNFGQFNIYFNYHIINVTKEIIKILQKNLIEFNCNPQSIQKINI